MVEAIELGGTETVHPEPKKKREKVVYDRVILDFVLAEAIRQNDLTWFLRQFSQKQVRDSLANEFFAKKRIPKHVWGSICQHELQWVGVKKMRGQATNDNLSDGQWEALKKAIRGLDPEHRKACNGIAQAERLIRTVISTNIKQLQGLPRTYRFWE